MAILHHGPYICADALPEATILPYQILTRKELKDSGDVPRFAPFTTHDLRPFELPIHGLWRRITASDVTPGMSRDKHDKRLPARTHIIGVREKGLLPVAVWDEYWFSWRAFHSGSALVQV